MAAKDAPSVEEDVDAIASAGGIDQASLFLFIRELLACEGLKTHVRSLDSTPSCEGILLGRNVGPSCWPDGTLRGTAERPSDGRRGSISLGVPGAGLDVEPA